MPFNNKIFRKILKARGIDSVAASKLVGMSRDRVVEAMDGKRVPTKNQVFKFAETLAVPAYAFFMDDFEIDEPELIDFRGRRPRRLKFGVDSARFARIFELRDFLAELYVRLDLNPPQQLFSEQPDENPEQFASTISKVLGIEELQKASKSKKDFYRALRDRIEELGVFVVQDHHFSQEIDGFAIYHNTFSSNLIYINSLKRNHGAKTFTLAHELAHILGKRSAISNNYQDDNEVEHFCNVFAASLLLPRGPFYEFVETNRLVFRDQNSAIRSAEKISAEFKTSVSAALVRAAELGLSEWKYYRSFSAGFGTPVFLDTIKPRGGGVGEDGPEPGIVDLALFGKRAVSIIASSLLQNATTDYEVFKRTGLSKKRIDGLKSIAAKESLNLQE